MVGNLGNDCTSEGAIFYSGGLFIHPKGSSAEKGKQSAPKSFSLTHADEFFDRQTPFNLFSLFRKK
jgi:hypothetical protein